MSFLASLIAYMFPRLWAIHRRVFLLLCLVLPLMAVGCGREVPVPENGPSSEIPGYYALGQTLEGGADIPGLTLSRIDAAMHGGETLISLTFASESGGLDETPRYTIIGLDGPSRLKITASARQPQA